MDSLFNWHQITPPSDAKNTLIWRDLQRLRETPNDDLPEGQRLLRAMAQAHVDYNHDTVRKLHAHLVERKKSGQEAAIEAAEKYLNATEDKK